MMWKRSCRLHIVLVIAVLVSIISVQASGPDPSELEYHDRMDIEGNNGLRTKARVEGWNGTGEERSPFIISGYLLTSDMTGVGLYLRNTSDHIIIRDCIFNIENNTGSMGFVSSLTLDRCSNISISNCSFVSGGIGCVLMTSSRNCTLKDSDIYMTPDTWGVGLEYSSYITVAGCEFRGSGGVSLWGSRSDDVDVRSNRFTSLDHSCQFISCGNLSVCENTIEDPTNYGFYITGRNCEVLNNSFNGSTEVMVVLEEMEEGRFCNNNISGTQIGLYCAGSRMVEVLDNDILVDYVSIVVSYCREMTIKGNEMKAGGIYVLGEEGDFQGHVITPDNTVGGRKVLYIQDEDLEGRMINENDISQIILANVSNCTIYNLELYDTFVPITVAGCGNISVAHCDIRGNSGAVYILGSERIHVLHNRVSDGENGFLVSNTKWSEFCCNRIDAMHTPIQMEGTVGCTFQENELNSSDYGFFVDLSRNDRIIENRLKSGKGIRIGSFSRTIIQNNTLGEGRISIPESLVVDGLFPEPKGNTIGGERTVYLFNRTDEDIDLGGDALREILVANCRGCDIRGAKLVGGRIQVFDSSKMYFDNISVSGPGGMVVRGSKDIRIEGSTFSDIYRGIGLRLYQTEGSEVKGCTFKNDMIGIQLDNSDRCTVENNSFIDCFDHGIKISNASSKHDIFHNRINGTGKDGVFVEYSDSNLIFGNNITGSRGYGIRLTYFSGSNQIFNNRFGYNHGSTDEYDEFHIQVLDEGDDNIWYFEGAREKVGNIWFDLRGPDRNSDGVVDEPYVIDQKRNIMDRYPQADGGPGEAEEDDNGMDSRTDSVSMFILMFCIIGVVAYLSFRVITQRE
ncbi:MAG: NosD domain-containing protein [Thermoplasmatota archaeon]